MTLSHVLAIGALVATVACNNSPTAPTPGGQVPPPGGQQTPTPGGQTPNPLPSGMAAVTIQDFTFSPASLTIKAGTTVRWTNNGPSAHTTSSDMGVWNSGVLGPPGGGGGMYGVGGSAGSTFDFTFMQPGTFPYHCALHPPSLYPGFTGTVTVTQ